MVGADLRYADLGGADLVGTSLRGANLRDANLRGASLVGASLRYADLGGADLRDADLRDANLRGANLRGVKGIITFIFQRHLAVCFKHGSSVCVKIGCMTFDIKHWFDNFNTIGEKEGYSSVEVEAYGDFIKWVYNKKDRLFNF